MLKFNFDNSYQRLPRDLFSVVDAAKVPNPQLLIFNNELAAELGLDDQQCSAEEMASLWSGQQEIENSTTIAQAYAGHQFAYFTMLGDGRAMLLGEHVNPKGKRVDIQLKGSGPTPYARGGDGKATLSAMLREYLFSEALHALNIPSTRSLALVNTGEKVQRETLHDGGILTRVASSHIRIGTFQYAAAYTSKDTLQQLLNYTIKRHYPHLEQSSDPALALFQEVMNRQIELVVAWYRVGFIHGVMNTDNVLLSGESIDFGPCAFLNSYQPQSVYSSIDHQGRYAFNNQANISLWNLSRLAESLLVLYGEHNSLAQEKFQTLLNTYQGHFEQAYYHMFLKKIGFSQNNEKHIALLHRLLSWMTKYKADFTNTFVQLMYPEWELNPCFQEKEVKQWLSDWTSENPSLTLMQGENPCYIPRNHLVEEAIELATKHHDMQNFNDFLKHLKQAYTKENLDLHYLEPASPNFDAQYKTYCGT